jgi:hypothetical protein
LIVAMMPVRFVRLLSFTSGSKPTALEILAPRIGAALRASLEVVAGTALDAADRIIAVLDPTDGELALAAFESGTGS